MSKIKQCSGWRNKRQGEHKLQERLFNQRSAVFLISATCSTTSICGSQTTRCKILGTEIICSFSVVLYCNSLIH